MPSLNRIGIKEARYLLQTGQYSSLQSPLTNVMPGPDRMRVKEAR